MSKNLRKQARHLPTAPPSQNHPPILSSRGKRVVSAGAVLVVLGFWILTYTDPAGQNWASTVSPALLVLGYALIGIGLAIGEAPNPVEPPK